MLSTKSALLTLSFLSEQLLIKRTETHLILPGSPLPLTCCYCSSSDALRSSAEEGKLNLTSSDGDDSAIAADRMLPDRGSSGSSRDIDGGTAWFCVLGMCM